MSNDSMLDARVNDDADLIAAIMDGAGATEEEIQMELKDARATADAVDAATPTPVKGQLLPKWATTPKRGATRKDKREPKALLAYAMEKGERIDLTPAVLEELNTRGIKANRVANAVCGLKKFYGIPVEAVRSGRKVIAYVVKLD